MVPSGLARCLYLLLLAALSGCLQAGSLEKLWDLDLKKTLYGELPARHSLKVESLLFSPDARQIVIVLPGRALLIRTQDPVAVPDRFQLDEHDSFGWSPDSQIVTSGRRLVRLADRKECDLPQNTLFPHFVGNDSLVAMPAPVIPPVVAPGTSPSPGYRTVGFYDANCKQQDSWNVEQEWGITDASPEHGLLSVIELSGSFRSLIVNLPTRQILHSGSGGWFADNGRAVCWNGNCWATDSGQRLAHSPVRGSAGAAGHVAARSSRIVLDDPHESAIPFSSAFTDLAARRRVWDFRSNTEVASWPLKFLTYWTSFDLDGFNRDRRPVPCAISPDGEYIAEGADGKVSLYKVRP